MPVALPQSRIKHIVVLMLENRSFDHLFGFFRQAPGQTIENLNGANSTLSNLLDPASPESANNPAFPVKQPAPFAVHDKDGPPTPLMPFVSNCATIATVLPLPAP